MDQLSAYQKVQLARHPQRPYFLDYIQHLCPDFVEMHGDRRFADDPAIVAGFGSLRDRRVTMLDYSIYSVIAPESCSAILWRDQLHAVEAAEALKLTPGDLQRCHLIVEIIPEPEGGAQNDPAGMAKCLGSVLERQLRELQNASPDELVDCRHKKFRAMGAFGE